MTFIQVYGRQSREPVSRVFGHKQFKRARNIQKRLIPKWLTNQLRTYGDDILCASIGKRNNGVV